MSGDDERRARVGAALATARLDLEEYRAEVLAEIDRALGLLRPLETYAAGGELPEIAALWRELTATAENEPAARELRLVFGFESEAASAAVVEAFNATVGDTEAHGERYQAPDSVAAES